MGRETKEAVEDAVGDTTGEILDDFDEYEQFYEDLFEQQRETCREYEDFLDDLRELQREGMGEGLDIPLPDSSMTPGMKDAVGDAVAEGGGGAHTLTDAQKSRLNALENTINDHLTDGDFSGTLRDLQGSPVPNGRGGYFDHLGEMQDSYKALQKVKKALEGSLKNPNLAAVDRTLLQEGLDKANFYIDKIEELFNGYGGIN